MEDFSLENVIKNANEGDAYAQAVLGVMYLDGNGIEKDLDKALYWFGRASDQGNMYAQYNLGLYYENDGKADEALEFYKKAASKGLDLAIFKSLELIGTKYGNESALHYCEKLADKGYDEAQFRLGTFYLLGIATKKDLERAFSWFIKAANNGSMRGLEMATVCVYNGLGTERDNKLAEEYAKEVLDVYFEDEDEILLPEFENICEKLGLDTKRK